VQFLGFNPELFEVPALTAARRGANSDAQEMFRFACFLPARADTNRRTNDETRMTKHE